MGKLNIAHHKSYHPYRRDNIEKVRRDEEEARRNEERQEGKIFLADSEARMDELRERAGSSRRRVDNTDDDDVPSPVSGSLPTTKGHINFFEDLEHQSIYLAAKVSKKPDPAESDKGFPLAPSAKDLKPWYADKPKYAEDEMTESRRLRDAMRKSKNDPLASIPHHLTITATTTPSSRRLPLHAYTHPSALPEVSARLTRESSERERALALIARKKREARGSETPVSERDGGEYSDLFNRREVEEAHARSRRREREGRWRDRGW